MIDANDTGRLPLLLRSFEVWLVIAAAESIHGALRTAWLAPLIGDFEARQIAVFTGSAIIIGVAFVLCEWMQARTFGTQILAGAFWVVLTLAFELGLGRLAMHLSWDRMLADYNLAHGGLMPLGLAIMLFAPAIADRLRRWHAAYDKQTAADRT